MEATVSKTALNAFSKGTLKIFAQAFMDCGIGGRFSKFRMYQIKDWVNLIPTDGAADTHSLIYRIHGQIDRRQMKEITSIEALEFGKEYPEWTTFLHTAQKVIAKIVRPGGPGNKYATNPTTPESRYFIHPITQTLYVANRMYILEITPKVRPAPHISTNAVYAYLATRNATVGEGEVLSVFTELDDVIVVIEDPKSGGKTTYAPQVNAVTFELMYGEAAEEPVARGVFQ